MTDEVAISLIALSAPTCFSSSALFSGLGLPSCSIGQHATACRSRCSASDCETSFVPYTNPTGNEDVTRIRNCETLRNGCESLRRHHWAVCEAARSRRESAAKPAKAPRKPRKRRESAAKKLRIRVTSPLPVGFSAAKSRPPSRMTRRGRERRQERQPSSRPSSVIMTRLQDHLAASTTTHLTLTASACVLARGTAR